MPRHYARKTDANQAAIVNGLRAVGATVLSAHRAGSDVPDLIVGYQGVTYLMEIKTDEGRLSDGQRKVIGAWRGGPAVVVRTLDEAFRAIGAVA